FGLRKEVRDAIVHLDRKTVLYPAGAFLVSHDTETHQQKLTVLQKPNPPTAMAVSFRRQYLAVCLAGAAQDPSGNYIRTEGELPSVSIYDIKTHPMRRVRSLVCGDVASQEYVAATFSADERVVGVQGGGPDWTLVLFVIEKSKVLSIFRLGDSPGLLSVSSIAFHPEDSGVLAVVGRKALRFLRLHDKLLKAYGYQAGLQHMCCSLVWADHYTLLVGTEEGTILLMEEGELKTTIVIEDPDNKTGKAQQSGPATRSPSKSGRGSQEDPSAADEVGGSAPRHRRVTCFAMFNNSFACACGPDKIFLFQRSDNIHEFYLQRHRLLVCVPSPASLVSGRGQHTVTSLSADSSGSYLVLTTHTGQIFTNVIPSLDDSQVASSVFRPLHTQHHSGAVVSADVCFWKPFCATVARDRSFLLWDYDQHLLLLQHTFKEDLYCVALHPTGFHTAVAFTDSLRLYHVMMDTLSGYYEVRVRRCSSCKFSSGGQFLAAADGSVVAVVHTVALKRHLTLKGHAGKILGVAWHPSDLQVFATAADGGVLGWDVATGSLAFQLQTSHGCTYSHSYLSLDNKGAVMAGSAAHLVEVTGGQLMQEESVEDLSAVGVGAVKTLLAVGTSFGSMAFSRVPRSFASGPLKPTPAHAARVVAICVTRDEGCLLTCGEDGSIVVWMVEELPPDAPGGLV
ncbi:WD40 repeat, partial [Trinorchestia longiramus]